MSFVWLSCCCCCCCCRLEVDVLLRLADEEASVCDESGDLRFRGGIFEEYAG